jgi:hypothetical protein
MNPENFLDFEGSRRSNRMILPNGGQPDRDLLELPLSIGRSFSDAGSWRSIKSNRSIASIGSGISGDGDLD